MCLSLSLLLFCPPPPPLPPPPPPPFIPLLLLSLKGAWKFRHWLNSFSLPAIVPFGAWFCPILPKPSAELTVVVGKPLQVRKELANGRNG